MEINEGVSVFKESKKFKKLIKDMETKVLPKLTDENDKEEVRKFIKKTKIAVADFEEVEKEFENGNKEKAKNIHNQLKVKHADVFKKHNKNLMKAFTSVQAGIIYTSILRLVFMFLFRKQIGTFFDSISSRVKPRTET